MFFRRPRPQQTTFAERLEAARAAGFQVEQLPGARVRISREGFATVIEAGGSSRWVERPGIELDGGIGALVDHGYQKFWETPEGRRKPALSVELKALHRFQEDLREALGMISLYNESLGTVSKFYLYDRVEDRDRGVPKRVWEH